MSYFTQFRLRPYGLTVAYIVLIFANIFIHGDSGDLAVIRTVEGFGLGAVAALYLVLVIGPLFRVFPELPGKSALLAMRGGFGDVAFALGVAHASAAFWGLLGGVSGWGFLGSTYKTATLLSFTALLILSALFIASLRDFPQRVFSRFPWFGKLGYVAAVLLVAHVALVGSHFRSITSSVFIVSSLLVAGLILLLARQCDAWFASRFSVQQSFAVTLLVAVCLGLLFGRWYLAPASGKLPVSIPGMDMSMHGMSMGASSSAEKYTLSVQTPEVIAPGKTVTFAFRVFSASTGTPVTDFALVHDKLAHLVIVNDALNYYSHVHPDFVNGQFTVQTSFPQTDSYRAYISFEPKGGSEQVFAYTFNAGSGSSSRPDKTVNASRSKTVGGISVGLSPAKISTADIASGKAYLTFRFTTESGQPVTDLYPYLAAFGHLVMINADTYSYLHVHPLVAPFGPDETGGPDVKFMVMGNVEPGVYKLFGQFNPHKELITVPFTIEVTK